MKQTAIKILQWMLKKLAQATIWRYRPGIIAVTGSVGKTSTKIAIATVLKAQRSVRFARGNFNNELGVPLTILGDYEKIEGFLFWPTVILEAIRRIIVKEEYPEILILEYGIDRPHDMKHLVSIARPNIGVMTAIGDVPVHVEFFDSPEALAREKARLIESLPVGGFAILNGDSDIVMGLTTRTRARVVTYGFGKGVDIAISNFANRVSGDRPVGISFRIEYAGTAATVTMDNVFGKSYAYAAAAGAAVGLAFGMHLTPIADALREYEPATSRMELIPGLKDTFILNDAYNASPLSMRAALDTLRDLPGKRKIAVLGDMLEIGKYAMGSHEAIGEEASKVADILITVGSRAKFIAEGARKAGMKKTAIYSFESTEETHPQLQEVMRKGDLVLLKASHSIGLESLVEKVRAF